MLQASSGLGLHANGSKWSSANMSLGALPHRFYTPYAGLHSNGMAQQNERVARLPHRRLSVSDHVMRSHPKRPLRASYQPSQQSSGLHQPGHKQVVAAALAVGADSRDHHQHHSSSESEAGNPWDAEIWSVALPALAAMLLEPVMGVINTGMIGRLGTQQLGAVSVASMIVSFGTMLFSFLLFLTTPDIAAAIVKKDYAEVSRITSKSLWVAGFFGLIMTSALWLKGPQIIALMAPPEPAVAKYAAEYVAVRAWGVMAVLIGFVATGTYRGFKDTRTPLYAAIGSAACSLVLGYLFIYVLQWGVAGSALAVTVSQAVSTSVLFGLLIKKGMLHVQDIWQRPSIKSVLPMLRKGVVLAVRNVISFGMIMYASTLCIRAGSTYQASYEIIRQIWILTIQFFECLNVACQTLCSTYLGAGDRDSAKGVLFRMLQLGCSVGAVVGVTVFALQSPIVHFFSKDAAVIAQVLATIPMICVMFPVDASASIMDGFLLAARQTDYMSLVQIVSSVFQHFILMYLASNNMVSTLSIWTTLKILTVARLGGGIWRNWLSPKSALRSPVLPNRTTAHNTSHKSGEQHRQPAESAEVCAQSATAKHESAGLQQPAVSTRSSRQQPLEVVGTSQSESTGKQDRRQKQKESDREDEEEDEPVSRVVSMQRNLAPELATMTVCAMQAAQDGVDYELLCEMHRTAHAHQPGLHALEKEKLNLRKVQEQRIQQEEDGNGNRNGVQYQSSGSHQQTHEDSGSTGSVDLVELAQQHNGSSQLRDSNHRETVIEYANQDSRRGL